MSRADVLARPGRTAGVKLGLATLVAIVLLGTAMVVGAANTLNCWLERDSDRFMARTKNRPLPAGRISARYWIMAPLARTRTSSDAWKPKPSSDCTANRIVSSAVRLATT